MLAIAACLLCSCSNQSVANEPSAPVSASASPDETYTPPPDLSPAPIENTSDWHDNHEIESFSFSYDMSVYVVGEPGVKAEGFYNTEINLINSMEDVIAIANSEDTIEYSETAIYYDKGSGMWRVLFHNGVPGGCQSVYFGNDGITKLIVYGE